MCDMVQHWNEWLTTTEEEQQSVFYTAVGIITVGVDMHPHLFVKWIPHCFVFFFVVVDIMMLLSCPEDIMMVATTRIIRPTNERAYHCRYRVDYVMVGMVMPITGSNLCACSPFSFLVAVRVLRLCIDRV